MSKSLFAHYSQSFPITLIIPFGIIKKIEKINGIINAIIPNYYQSFLIIPVRTMRKIGNHENNDFNVSPSVSSNGISL